MDLKLKGERRIIRVVSEKGRRRKRKKVEKPERHECSLFRAALWKGCAVHEFLPFLSSFLCLPLHSLLNPGCNVASFLLSHSSLSQFSLTLPSLLLPDIESQLLLSLCFLPPRFLDVNNTNISLLVSISFLDSSVSPFINTPKDQGNN